MYLKIGLKEKQESQRKDGDSMKKKRKKFITSETVINIDEEVFKLNAQQLWCEMLVEYANEKYGYTVLELNFSEKRAKRE
jgi:hypothetical protein